MKQHNMVEIVIFCWLLMCTTVEAIPRIMQEPTGIFNQGQSVSVHGSGFGINNAVGTTDLQWLGDNIESGADGDVFAATGWAQDAISETDTRAVARYDVSQSHSGNKSIRILYDHTGSLNRYRGHFMLERLGMDKLYITYWTRGHWDGISNGQWKQIRVQRESSPVNSSGGPGFYLSKSKNSGNLIENFTKVPVESSSFVHNGSCVGPVTGINAHYLPYTALVGNSEGETWDKWLRYEIYTDLGSPGNTDGTLMVTVHNPDSGITVVAGYDGCIKMRESDVTDKFNYVLFGHYAGDGFSNVTGWWDDVFIQVGTQARVEIGNAPTWSACTHREVQVPTAWSDNIITFKFQQGSFSPGDQVYVFVVDDNGVVSAGKGPITIGDTETSVTPSSVKDFHLN